MSPTSVSANAPHEPGNARRIGRATPIASRLAVTTARREATIIEIDAANAQDPNSYRGQPLALLQGRAASRWLNSLCADASDELRLAVRAHHLRRWELKRTDYPHGRAGYLQWRRENKAHQAASLAELMAGDGWSDRAIERTGVLLSRTKLRTDPDTQLLEDAACLVFLETQFDDMARRSDHAHLVAIVTKTLKKMSPAAVSLATSIALSNVAQAVLAEAVEEFHQGST